MRHARLLSLLAAGLVIGPASVATAQLAPPPPDAEPKPEYVAPARPERNPTPAPSERPNPRPQTERQGGTLPDLPHAPLWCPIASIPACEDYDGPVAVYDRSIHIMALERNPTTTPGQVGDFQSMIATRRRDLEPKIIDNLDTMMDVEQGLIDQVSLVDVDGMRQIAERIEPLVVQPYLTASLRQKGVLSRVQADWNDKLIREYQDRLGQQWSREQPDRANDLILQYIFKDSVAEAEEALRAMLLEIALRPDEILDTVQIPSDPAEQMRAAKVSLDELQSQGRRQQKIEEIRLAWRTLAVEDRKKLLRAVLETRAEGAGSLVDPITVTYDGKRVQPGKAPEIRREFRQP